MSLADQLRNRLGYRLNAPYGPTLDIQIEELCGLLDERLETRVQVLPPMHAQGTEPHVTARTKRQSRKAVE